MEKLRFGIVGCGVIAERFAKALNQSEAARLYACAARSLTRAEEFSEEHGAEKAYGSYEELISDPEVQAVYIATVHTTHAKIARQCIEAGKPVISEKPFFISGKEALETIKTAREKRILMMEGFWTRTLPAYLKTKEWIKSGRIGDVTLIRAAFCFPMPLNDETRTHRLWNPEVGGGALWDAGVYPYEYATGIMDGAPSEIQSMVQWAPSGVDAAVSMTMRWPCGTIADCMTGINGYMDDTAVISGTEGYIKQYHFLGCRRAELYLNSGELIERYEDPEEEGFVHEIAHFAELYRNGKTESDLIPLDDTLDFAIRSEEILKQARMNSDRKIAPNAYIHS